MPLINRMRILLKLIVTHTSRVWLTTHRIPELLKDVLILVVTTLFLIFVTQHDEQYAVIFTIAQVALYVGLLGLGLITLFITLTENDNLSMIRERSYNALRKIALFSAYANVAMAVFFIVIPLIITTHSTNPNIVVGSAMAVIILAVMFKTFPGLQRTPPATTAENKELRTIFSDGSQPTFNYSVVTKQSLKRLYLYQTARILMLNFIRDLPTNVPLSVIDKSVGSAAIYIQQDRCQSIEILEWMLMFLMMGPTAERGVTGSKSILSFDDELLFNKLATQYLVLTKTGFCGEPTTEREELTKLTSIATLKRRTMVHCHRFLKDNNRLIVEIYALLQTDDQLTLAHLDPILSRVCSAGTVPAEVRLERTGNPQSIKFAMTVTSTPTNNHEQNVLKFTGSRNSR